MSKSKSSLSIVNYIIGISDGLLLPIIPCGLISIYFSVGKNNNSALIFIGLYFATVCIVAFVYGLARYLGEKNEIKHNHPDIAKADFLKDKERLLRIGIDHTLAVEMMQKIGNEQKDWLREIKENEMGWDSFDINRAKRSGMQTGLGFILGSCLVLVPFLFLRLNPFELTFYLFFISEFAVMFLFGWLKGKYLQKDALRLAIYQVLMSVWIIIVFFFSALILLSLST